MTTTEERNVDYILLAEFDIDEGSTIREQYPTKTGEDTGTLANLMLPDGAHKHERDWTIFMLNRDVELEHERRISRRATNREKFAKDKERQAQRVSKLEADEAARRETSLKECEALMEAARKETRAKLEAHPERILSVSAGDEGLENPEDAEVPQPVMGRPSLPQMSATPVYLYECSDPAVGWKPLDEEMKHLAVREHQIIFFNDVETRDAFIMIEMHEKLQYTELEPLFSAVFDEVGTAIGIRFVDPIDEECFVSHVEELEDLLEQFLTQQDARNEWLQLKADFDAGAEKRAKAVEQGKEKAAETAAEAVKKEWDEKETRAALLARESIEQAKKRAEKTAKNVPEVEDDGEEEISVTHLLYCLNLVRTKMDESRRRGAHVLALAVCTRFSYYDAFRPLLALALEKFFPLSPNQYRGVMQQLFEAMNALDVSEGVVIDASASVAMSQKSVPVPDSVKQLGNASKADVNGQDPSKKDGAIGAKPTGAEAESLFPTEAESFIYSGSGEEEQLLSIVRYGEENVPLRFPKVSTMDQVGGTSVRAIVRTFKEQTRLILSSLLHEERVFFFSRDRPAQEVCLFVLSAVQMISPPLEGLIKRVFPYTSLVDMEFLEVAGYVAGGCNPIFEAHPEWWDILCDIDFGKVFMAYDKKVENAHKFGRDFKEPPPPVPKYLDMDCELISSLLFAIESGYREPAIRMMFQEYSQHMVDVALNVEVFESDEVRMREEDVLSDRSRRLHATKQVAKYKESWNKRKSAQLIQGIDLHLWRRRLAVDPNISPLDLQILYQQILKCVGSQEQIGEFLGYFPESAGGLSVLAVHLFHQNQSVRFATVALLARLDSFKNGRRLINHLDAFLLQAYERNVRLVKATLS